MKKLMLVAAVAAMSVMSAKAEYSCDLYSATVANAKGDENPGDSVIRSGYYQAYIIQNAGADVNAVADYVNGKTVAQIASEAKVTYTFAESYFNWRYSYSWRDASQDTGIDINPYQAYLVSFYGTPGETPTEFFVVANDLSFAVDDDLLFNDDTCATSGWQSYTAPGPAPIPEPTSGLLLLIGVAGLALKRKRA